MSDEAPKSALELAMERLRLKDAEDGVVAKTLTADQKAEIAQVRQVYAAKVAQEEILFKSKLASARDPEERMKLEEGHRRDLQRLGEERERKIEKLRGQAS